MDEKNFLSELSTVSDKNIFEQIKSHNLPVIIFGAKVNAAHIAKTLEQNKIKISGYAVDEKYYKPNQFCCGLPIHNFDELAQKPNEYVFILGVSEINRDRIKQFYDAPIVKYDVAVGSCCKINYDFVMENKTKFIETYNWLSDDFSKKTITDFLKAHITRDFSYLRDSIVDYPEYFNEYTNSLLQRNTGGINYVDCGAYVGDTVKKFIEFTEGKYEKIFAIEPDTENFLKLEQFAQNNELKNVEIFNCGVWNEKTVLKFNNRGHMGSAISKNGVTEVAVDTIDNIVGDTSISFIKMDVEGSDLNALYGAIKTLERSHPILVLSVYHRVDDLITIPQFVKTIYKNCRFYLRKHEGHDLYSLDLYVIPE